MELTKPELNALLKTWQDPDEVVLIKKILDNLKKENLGKEGYTSSHLKRIVDIAEGSGILYIEQKPPRVFLTDNGKRLWREKD